MWDVREHHDFSLAAILEQAGMVHSVKWSPRTSFLASAGAAQDGALHESRTTHTDKGARRGQVLLWDSETRQKVATLGAAQSRSLAAALDFQQGGHHTGLHEKYSAPLHKAEAGGVYSHGGHTYTINGRVYQGTGGKGNGQRLAALESDGGAVTAIAWSPDSEHVLAAGGRNGVVRMWDIRCPAAAVYSIQGHTDHIRGLTFSPCGSLLVSCGQDSGIRLWGAGSGQAMDPAELKQHGTHPVMACAFAHNWTGPYTEDMLPKKPTPPPPRKTRHSLQLC